MPLHVALKSCCDLQRLVTHQLMAPKHYFCMSVVLLLQALFVAALACCAMMVQARPADLEGRKGELRAHHVPSLHGVGVV